MKLNNKGFAISSIMYIVMIMCVVLILLTLSILSSRKIILDKQKNNVLDALYKNGENLKPNEPLLLDGLIPVLYDDNTWKVADINDYWYDYSNKKWANAVILKDAPKKIDVGMSLDISNDVKAMFVWIPKYEYKISGDNISINFIDASKTKPSNEYKIHPAFVFGGKNLTGIWVGKFETTGNIDNLTILPNETSKILENVNSSFAISNTINIDGYNSHMAKNIEWGAVSYLAYSNYGIKNIGTNSCGEYKTGMGSNCEDTYENGTSSTTGNITGVYDMNGGRGEYVMGVFNKSISSSEFENLPSDDYFDNYTSITNCNNGTCYGDALSETNNINTGSKTFIDQTNSWIIRDSLFGYLSGNGTSNNETFRIVLTKS